MWIPRNIRVQEVSPTARWMAGRLMQQLPPQELRGIDTTHLLTECEAKLHASINSETTSALVLWDSDACSPAALGLLSLGEEGGRRVAYIHHLTWTRSARVVAPLLSAFEQHPAMTGVDWIYAEFPALADLEAMGLAQSGWRTYAYVVRRELNDTPELAAPQEGFRIRPFRPGDEWHVLDCLVRAMWTGLPPELRGRSSLTELRAQAEDEFLPLTDRRWLSLIVENAAGEFCGHALFELDVPHPYTGCLEVRQIDIFTLDPVRNRGLARALVSTAAAHSRRLGYRSLWGTVTVTSDEATARKLLTDLESSGWWCGMTLAGKPGRTLTQVSLIPKG